MNHTPQSNSFERISFRAVVAISIVSLFFGGLISFFQYQEVSYLSEDILHYSEENDKLNTPEYNTCINNAFKSDDSNAQINRCVAAYSPDPVEMDKLYGKRNNAHRWINIGLVMMIIPMLLFTLYFLLRWIFTGRWKRAA